MPSDDLIREFASAFIRKENTIDDQPKSDAAGPALHLRFDTPLTVLADPSAEFIGQLDRVEKNIEKILATQDTILQLVDRRPVKFTITLTPIGEHNLAKLKAAIDFQLLDNGQAAATLGEIDSVGLPTSLPAGTSVPAWTSSDPTVVSVTPAADGLSAVVGPASPAKLGTGVTIGVSATLPNGNTISGTSDPIDVIAGGPAGFQISLQ